MLQQLIYALDSSKLLAVAASIASIIGVVIPSLVWLQKRRRHGKRLAYSVRTSYVPLYDPSRGWALAGISEVAIWNAGTEIIDADDVASAEPLAVVVGQGEVRQVEITFQANFANRFRLKDQGPKVLVQFDYCSPGEGLKLVLLHTNASFVELRGVVKAFGSPTLRPESPFREVSRFPEVERTLEDAGRLLWLWRPSQLQFEAKPPSMPYPPTDEQPAPAISPSIGSSVVPSGRRVASVRRRLLAAIAEIAALALPSAITAFALRGTHVEGLLFAFVVILGVLALVSKTTAALCQVDSVGLHWIGLQVLSFDGQPATKTQRLSRLLAGTLALIPMGIGLIWALLDEEHLTLTDHLSETFLSSHPT